MSGISEGAIPEPVPGFPAEAGGLFPQPPKSRGKARAAKSRAGKNRGLRRSKGLFIPPDLLGAVLLFSLVIPGLPVSTGIFEMVLTHE